MQRGVRAGRSVRAPCGGLAQGPSRRRPGEALIRLRWRARVFPSFGAPMGGEKIKCSSGSSGSRPPGPRPCGLYLNFHCASLHRFDF